MSFSCFFPLGAPLSVVLVSAANSAFFSVQFVDYWAVSADVSQTFAAEKIHLLVLCKSGALHTVTTGRGTQSCTMQLTARSPQFDILQIKWHVRYIIHYVFSHYLLWLHRPADSRDLLTVTTVVPFLQGLVGTLKLPTMSCCNISYLVWVLFCCLIFLASNSHLWCKEMEKCSSKMSSTKPLCASWLRPQKMWLLHPAILFMRSTTNSKLCSYEVDPNTTEQLYQGQEKSIVNLSHRCCSWITKNVNQDCNLSPRWPEHQLQCILWRG